MAGIPLHDVRQSAQAGWSCLRDSLVSVLGDDLVAMWAYGPTTSADSIDSAQDAIARETGAIWDVWYIVADDARRSNPPPHAWLEGRRDTAWGLHRAHWLAGGYVNLHGPDPDAIVLAPSWGELEGELDRELEHIERHVAEGDTDPYEATYAILNGSRILRSLASHDVVTSKRSAGTWALGHLPDRWEVVVRAALRSYDGRPSDGDLEVLEAEMSPFIAFVREHLAPTTDRSADALPRWSGY